MFVISLGKAGEFICYFCFIAYQVDYKSRIAWEGDTVELTVVFGFVAVVVVVTVADWVGKRGELEGVAVSVEMGVPVEVAEDVPLVVVLWEREGVVDMLGVMEVVVDGV